MNMSLSHGMHLRQQMDMKMPFSFGAIAMAGLSAEEMEELAKEMAELAERGLLKKSDAPSKHTSNLFDSEIFVEHAHGLSADSRQKSPEYTIAPDCSVQSKAIEVRERIEQCLSVLTRTEPAKPQEIFSKRFLDEFDWITTQRQELVSFAATQQKAYIAEPYNPLLLTDLTQEKLSDVIRCCASTVSRLISGLLVEMPDATVRDFAILVPGASLSKLQGRYVVGLLAQDNRYFDAANRCWRISDDRLTEIVRSEYNLDVQRRVVRNYRNWVDEHLLKPRRTSGDEYDTGENEDEEFVM